MQSAVGGGGPGSCKLRPMQKSLLEAGKSITGYERPSLSLELVDDVQREEFEVAVLVEPGALEVVEAEAA